MLGERLRFRKDWMVLRLQMTLRHRKRLPHININSKHPANANWLFGQSKL